jgi:glycerate-2-kinase
VRHSVLASNRSAIEAARRAARRAGLDVRVVSPPLAGEARDAGRLLAELALRARPTAPLLLVAGGETVVTVRGGGRGGRNQELALGAALALEGAGPARVSLLAAGTDGSDGPTDAAGAFADAGTLARGAAAGVDAAAALADNDAYGFFAAEGGLLRTGPTGTNVMDLALIHVSVAA